MSFNLFKHHRKTNEKISQIKENTERTYVTLNIDEIKKHDICWEFTKSELNKYDIRRTFTKNLIEYPESYTITSSPPEFTLEIPTAPKGVNQKEALKKLQHRYVAVFDMKLDDLNKVFSGNNVKYLGEQRLFPEKHKVNLKLLKENLLDVHCDLLNPDTNKWMRVKDYTMKQLKRAEHLHTAGEIMHGAALAMAG